MRCQVLHIYPNSSREGLKWPWKCFLTTYRIKIVLPFFIVGESQNLKTLLQKIGFPKRFSNNPQHFGCKYKYNTIPQIHKQQILANLLIQWNTVNSTTVIPTTWMIRHFIFSPFCIFIMYFTMVNPTTLMIRHFIAGPLGCRINRVPL